MLLALLALDAILVSPLPAADHGWGPFDQQSFEQAKAVGKTVVLHIARPATLVVYKGMVEVGRSTGATDEAAVRALIRARL